jgi:hypothetical protein
MSRKSENLRLRSDDDPSDVVSRPTDDVSMASFVHLLPDVDDATFADMNLEHYLCDPDL